MKKELSNQMGRLGAVDILRGFGILMMVMGHIWFGNEFDVWIHSFHMPMWFIISGYFFNSKKIQGKYIVKKIRVLLIPYVIFSLIFEIVWMIEGHNQWYGMLFPNTVEVPINGALWFLPAMFFADIIAFFILKYIRGIWGYLFIAAISVFGSLHLVELPLSIDSALTSVGFILIGYLIKLYGERLLSIKLPIAIIGLVLFSCLAFANGLINVRLNTYSIIPLFYLV